MLTPSTVNKIQPESQEEVNLAKARSLSELERNLSMISAKNAQVLASQEMSEVFLGALFEG